MAKAKKAESMHANADWIINCSNNKEGAAVIAEKFNRLKRKPRGPHLTTQDMYNFIKLEKERRASKDVNFHPMMTNLWTAEGMGASV